jgi:hypothetical protein
VRRRICITWNNFVTQRDKTSVINKAGARKGKQNKAEQELKASDGHPILFTFIVHTRQEKSTISKKKKSEAWFCLFPG